MKFRLFSVILLFIGIALTSHGQVNPEEAYPKLFHAVQLNRVFADSKTFVDCIPRKDPENIREIYRRSSPTGKQELKSFVKEHFILPRTPDVKALPDEPLNLKEHIRQLWDVLQRKDSTQNPFSSRIALPKPYIVPGGRFREMYYWDSYFTMLGLQESGREQDIRNMTENFAWLLAEYGHIPNGNRTYYLSRSQPPFFASMVDMLAGIEGDSVYTEFLPALKTEYAYWMKEKNDLTNAHKAKARVVRMPDGSVLNRFWDEKAKPRPESYLEDFQLAQQADRSEEEIYRDLRAACESGWDFSSRWLEDGRSLTSIHTTSIIPVDLNTLLLHLEQTLSQAWKLAGNPDKSRQLAQAAEQRKKAINKYCYDADAGFFVDYNFVSGQPTGVLSLAGVYPLYFKIATKQQAARVKENLGRYFIFEGGLVSTLRLTREQWDTPNGWAPLHWIAVQGLRNYNHKQMAMVIARDWLRTNERVFEQTGKMMEKYNVLCPGAENGGGEYPAQDGFGWTNGVYLKLDNL